MAPRKRRILSIWFPAVAAFLASLIWSDTDFEIPFFINYSLQLLLFIISVHIFRHEPTQKNKLIFLNFAIVFGFSFFFHAYNFVGTAILGGQPFARFYLYQYVSLGAYLFFFALAICYLTIDALFRDFKTYQKYLLTVAVVGCFFGYYYKPLLTDPMYLYHTEDVLNWKALDKSSMEYRETNGVVPSAEQLAEVTELHAWKDGVAVGTLYMEEKLKRVQELYPYLEGSNYMILVQEPLYMNVIYMNVVCLGLILLFFGYQYKKDPPQGAYIEKVMFMFLVLCSVEIFHSWSFIKSVEWEVYRHMLNIGQYVSIAVLLFITLFFGMRLRFITSVKGEFYEQEILSSPGAVTRWIDWIDELVIAHFFNRKALLGRMFVDPSTATLDSGHSDSD